MAIVPMQKVAVLAHRSLRDAVVEALHDQGVLEVADAGSALQTDHIEAQFTMAELDHAIRQLQEIAPKIAQAALRSGALEANADLAAHAPIRGIIDELHALNRSDEESMRMAEEATASMELLSPWRTLPGALDAPRGSMTTVGRIGTIPAERIADLHAALQGSYAEVLHESGGVAYVLAVVRRGNERAFEETATKLGWTDGVLPALPGTAEEQYTEALSRKNNADNTIAANAARRLALADRLPLLLSARLALAWAEQRRDVREKMTQTSQTVTLLGWMPRADIAALEERLQRISPAVSILRIKPDDGEEAPILLRHSKLLAPFTSVTTLYGLPRPSEFDPTAPLSPFFILFFALCLTDAGYGLALFAIFSVVLLRIRRTPSQAPLLWLLWMSGIVTFFVGLLFGGWFGLTPDQVPDVLTRTTASGERLFLGQLWNLSTQAGVTFLQYLSLVLGLVHLLFGMMLAGIHKWVHGQKAAALWQDFTSHLLVGSVILFFALPSSMESIARIILIVSAVLAVWGKGYGSPWYIRPVMGVLGIVNFAIGMLSNGLSYLRILALGLVTGAMALAVNQVAIELGKLFPVWLAIPVITLVFAGGHIVSLALNTLGSFIHSGRLQFIEFFSQFFEGGGRPYSPFQRTS